MTSLTPPLGTQVQKGERVDVLAEFAYTTCGEGRIFVTFQDQSEAGGIQPPWVPAGSVASVRLPLGRGDEKLTATLTVPDRDVSLLNAKFLFQYIGVRGGTTLVLNARYPVE